MPFPIKIGGGKKTEGCNEKSGEPCARTLESICKHMEIGNTEKPQENSTEILEEATSVVISCIWNHWELERKNPI